LDNIRAGGADTLDTKKLAEKSAYAQEKKKAAHTKEKIIPRLILGTYLLGTF